MDNIGFLVWSPKLAVGDADNALTARYLRKSCSLIEAKINDAGGIGGKKATILYTQVPGGAEGVDQVLTVLRKTPEIAFVNGGINTALKKKFEDECDMASHILFGSSGDVRHPNIFNISRASYSHKVQAIAHLLAEGKQDARVFFIHDGKRIATFEEEFSTAHPGQFKSLNFWDYQETSEIEEHLAPLLADIDDNDVLILDVGLRVYRQIFDHLNETEKRTRVIKVFGSIAGRFPKIGFPLIEIDANLAFPYLDLEHHIKRTEIPLSGVEKELIKDSSWRLEMPLLVAYAARQAGCTFTDKAQFLADIRTALNAIDGKRDIYIGMQLLYAFEENKNTAKTNYLYQYPSSLQTPGVYPRIFYPLQFCPGQNEATPIVVNYLYIDMLRVTNIDIGDGTWSAEFYLDIISPHETPIDIIKFNNLSSLNPKFEAKLMWERGGGKVGGSTFRYYVVANFDFMPEADNYPFDWQHIFISYSLTDQARCGLIQPTPEALLDNEFLLNGWVLKDAVSGILRKKTTIYENAALEKNIDVSEEVRLGWTLARANSTTVLKIGIPLFFLLFLVYYTLFAPFDGNNSFAILTTAFLSAIALYFSTERPQPLRMTTIDLIFIWFYILTGVTIITTAVGLSVGTAVYATLMCTLKFLIPVSVICIVTSLWRRIRSSPFKISINR